MNEIAEYERRISAALSRIAYGIETLQAQPVAVAPVAPTPVVDVEAQAFATDTPENAATEAADGPTQQSGAPHAPLSGDTLESLRAALDAERAANGQLSERVRAIREKQETTLTALERKLGHASRTAEAATGEIARLKRANAELVEINAALTAAAGDMDANLVNRTMQAELEALRAARSTDAQEIADLLAALEPLAALAHSPDPQEETADA